MKNPYEDIIDLPHPTSDRHPRMSIANRAAQFSPFAALTGYDDAVKEAARLTDRKMDLTEEEKSVLDTKLQRLLNQVDNGIEISFTYFQPDSKKEGGAYLTATGIVKKTDHYAQEIVLTDGRKFKMEDIVEIEGVPLKAL